MRKDYPEKNVRDFFRIVMVSSAVGFGGLTASLYSLKREDGGLSIQLTLGTGVAFAVGAVLACLYWRAMMKLETSVGERQSQGSRGARKSHNRLRFVFYSSPLFGGGLLAFLYPLRYVPRERIGEVAQGLLLAFIFLSLLGWLLWRVKRFLDRDSEKSESSGSS